MFTEPHVDLLPCGRCGLVPGWMEGEGPGCHRRLLFPCSYRCGEDNGVIGLGYPDLYPDPARTPPLFSPRSPTFTAQKARRGVLF